MDEDHPSIDVVFGLESIDRHDDIAIISAMRGFEKDSPPLNCFDATVSVVSMNAVKLNSIDRKHVYDSMPIQQDQVAGSLSSISAALDPFTFTKGVVNDVSVSNFKISVGATSAIPPDEPDNLWIDEEPISMTINLDNLDDSIASLESKIGAVGKHPKGVSANHLSKIWSIDTDTAKRTIDVTTQLCKHGETDHLRR
jgi:hypothetical protein